MSLEAHRAAELERRRAHSHLVRSESSYARWRQLRRQYEIIAPAHARQVQARVDAGEPIADDFYQIYRGIREAGQ